MADDTIRVRPERTDTTHVVERQPLTPAAADVAVTRRVEPTPEFVLGRPHLHWGPIWAGLLSALTALFLLSLLGAAIGLSGMNAATAAAQGGPPPDAGRNSAIWEGIAGILSFLLGGYVAARVAHLLDRNWGAFHGAMVFMLALPIVLWLAGQGLGAVLGTVGNVASGLNVAAGQAAGAAQSAASQAGAAARSNPTAVGDTAAALRNGMWGSLIGSLLGLGASTLGGWLGSHHLLSLDHTRRVVR